MKNILHIISSPRGEASYSNQLGSVIITKLLAAHPGSQVKKLDLAEDHYPHIGIREITSFFTPTDAKTSEHLEAARNSDEAIADLMAADIIVIGIPLYNFNMPSTLKAWLDHIIRAGITFTYSAEGPEGLIKGKKVYVALASGGIYSEGPMKTLDFVPPYLTSVFGFIGLKDITVVRVEGTSIPGLQETALEKAVQSIAI